MCGLPPEKMMDFRMPTKDAVMILEADALCALAEAGPLEDSIFKCYKTVMMPEKIYTEALKKLPNEYIKNVQNVKSVETYGNEYVIQSLEAVNDFLSAHEAECIASAMSKRSFDILADDPRKIKVIEDSKIGAVRPADMLYQLFRKAH